MPVTFRSDGYGTPVAIAYVQKAIPVVHDDGLTSEVRDSLRALRSPGEQSDDEDPPESTELVDEPRFLQCLEDAGEMERE